MGKYEVTVGKKTWVCDTLAEARAVEAQAKRAASKTRNGDIDIEVGDEPVFKNHYAAFDYWAAQEGMTTLDLLGRIRDRAVAMAARRKRPISTTVVREASENASKYRVAAHNLPTLRNVQRAKQWQENFLACMTRQIS